VNLGRNGDCRPDVGAGSLGGASYRTLSVPSPAAGRFDPVIVPRCIEPPATGLYREQALEFVRAYQKVFPYWPWTYSLDALLEKDATARSLAA